MIYGICFKDTKDLVSAQSFKKYWPNYGGNNLHGWRPPRKVYHTLPAAKSGLRFVPKDIRDKVAIYELVATNKVFE